MKTMQLIKYEYMKLWKRKSVPICFVSVLFLLLLTGSMMAWGSIKLDDVEVSTQSEYLAMERKAGESIKGRKMDDETMWDALEKQEEHDNTVLTPKNWKAEYEEYMPYRLMLDSFLYFPIVPEKSQETVRRERLEELFEGKKLSEGEKAYLFSLDEKTERPMEYAYNEGYSRFHALQVSTMMIIAIFLVICLAPMFAEEVKTKTDALILSSQYGRGHLFAAKMITGITFAAVTSFILYVAVLIEQLVMYGMGDASLPMQQIWNLSTSVFPFSIAQSVAVCIGCGVLSSCMVGLLMLLFSFKLKSSFATSVIGIILAFLPSFASILPENVHWLMLIANVFPGCFGTYGNTFADQLLKLGDAFIPAYLYGPVCYLLIAAILILVARKMYVRRQVS